MKRIPIILAILLAMLSAIGCGGSDSPANPADTSTDPDTTSIPESFPGEVRFTTSGTEINGVPTRLRGMNMVDPIAQATWGLPEEVGPYSRSYYEEARTWGAEIVRIPIHPEFWREDIAQSMGVMRQVVDWSAELGLYVILDFHGIGMLHQGRFEEAVTTTSTAEFLEFWRLTSIEFADDDHIAAYGLFNEQVNLNSPDTTTAADWLAWKADAETAIDVIRANDSGTAILVGGLHWSYDLSLAVAHPIERDYIAYDVHVYPFTPDFKSWEEAIGEPSRTLPIFVGEWGWDVTGLYDELDFGEPGEYGPAVIAFMNSHNFSWTAWVFSAVWDPRMLTDWDYGATDFGAFVRSELAKGQ